VQRGRETLRQINLAFKTAARVILHGHLPAL